MTDKTPPLLEVRDMTLWRGDNLLLDELSFSAQAGSATQIQGTNGTGKTTLLRAIIGLAEFDEGEVLWKGTPMHKARESMHAGLIYIGHKAGISPHLTPYENLRILCPELSALPRSAFAQVLEELSIGDRIDLPCSALSAGQRRRVVLCRLRLQHADLWILDEPLTSLDTHGCNWVRQEIRRHVKTGGTVIFTTHQPMEVDDVNINALVLGTDK